MFHLLKKTVQPIKSLLNSNNVIKLSTMNVSSIPNRHQLLFSNQMNMNCSKRIHNGFTLQVEDKSDIQRKNVSKSFSPFNIPAHLSKVREAVEKKDFYPWTKPEKSLLKHVTATLSNNNNNSVLGQYQSSDVLGVFLMSAGVVGGSYFPWNLLRRLYTPNFCLKMVIWQLERFKKARDEKVKTAKIELEFWTIFGDLMEDVGKMASISFDLDTNKMAEIIMNEMESKPKEEWNPKFRHICEKLEAYKKQNSEGLGDILIRLKSYEHLGDLTDDERQDINQYLRRVNPKVRKIREDFEEIKSLILNLNIQDFGSGDTEIKNSTSKLSSINNNNNSVLGEHQRSDFSPFWIAAGLVGAVYFLWNFFSSSHTSDFTSQFEEFKKARDEKVKTAKIEFEFWTAFGDLGEEIYKIIIIYHDLKKTKMGEKIMNEMDTKPKEEWNPEFRPIYEKLEQFEEIGDILKGLKSLRNNTSYRYFTEKKKQEATPYFGRVLSKVKKFRQDLEETKSLIQNLNIQDFSNEDTETKNSKCS